MKKRCDAWFIIFVIFGIYLIADGLLSILFNLHQGWFAQLIRILRLLIGIVLIIVNIKFLGEK